MRQTRRRFEAVPRFGKYRPSEWLLIGYFAYVPLIAPFFRSRPHLKLQPVFLLLAVWLLLSLLALAEQQSKFAIAIGHVRDWLPILLTLAAFREMELFVPARYDRSYENHWVQQDHILLASWHIRSAIEALGKFLPCYLELCYFLVYGLSAYCIGLLYALEKRFLVDRFLLIYLTGTLVSYALFPYFPTQPPRLVFPGIDAPSFSTWIRDLNLWALSAGTIHASVFPSAHVSSAFSAAWGMFLILPERKLIGIAALVYAVSVSVATIYGRYHYSADALSGFGVSLLAGLVGLLLRAHLPAPAAGNPQLARS